MDRKYRNEHKRNTVHICVFGSPEGKGEEKNGAEAVLMKLFEMFYKP